MCNKDVTIIFVNYKTKDLTTQAIKSVIEKTVGIEYEIFVVDNASNDGSIEAIEQQFSNINIIRNSVNAGFGSANNLAIKQAKGKYILCLNTDTLLVNNAIKIMFDFMEKDENKNVGVCGGYLFDETGNPCFCGGNFPSIKEIFWKFGLKYIFKNKYKKIAVALKSNEIKGSNIDHIIGANIFFRKSCLDKVGLFDEKFFMYREETDLCKRISDIGYDIKFVPAAHIIHLEGASTNNQKLDTLKRLKTSELYYFKKHYSNQVYIVKILYFLLYLLDYYLCKTNYSKDLAFYILKEKIQ